MQPKYGSEVKLCYMDADSLVYEIETEAFYKDIANDVETKFDTSSQGMIQATTNTKEQEGYKHDEKRTWWKKHGRVCCNEVKDVCV